MRTAYREDRYGQRLSADAVATNTTRRPARPCQRRPYASRITTLL